MGVVQIYGKFYGYKISSMGFGIGHPTSGLNCIWVHSDGNSNDIIFKQNFINYSYIVSKEHAYVSYIGVWSEHS